MVPSLPDPLAERSALALFDEALDVDPGHRAAWLAARCGGDTTLRARVEALLRADAASSLIAGIAAPGPAPLPPPQIGPYRLEALIGSGGMGSVYRARRVDGLFEQTVAIKFVRPQSGREVAQALVDAERRTLARMRHPGIARILDGGSTADGLQYLVMEHVEGMPIDEHMNQAGLDARERVRLLLAVCAAVADAHRQLVLHCDLKPANILVDADGRPRLIDFGVARLRDVIDPALPQGYTRGYASPQRLAGEPPSVADEVYALGMLLVELLGVRDAELAAVARCAIADDAAARYPSVDHFAADLQRWLELRPVQALPDSWRYRAAKLLQRHPWRVASAATALGTLLVALVLIATLYLRAETARHEAERRFDEVRSLANYMLGELDDRLAAAPGTTTLRRELVERGERYLAALAQSAGENPVLQHDVAVGLGRLAEIQGGWATPNTGERGDTRALFERAESLLVSLVRGPNVHWTWRRDLGRLQQRLADFYGGVDNDSQRQLAKAKEAEATLGAALSQAEAGGASPAERGELHALLSATRLMQAFALNWLGDSPRAEALARGEEARLLALPAEVREAVDLERLLGQVATQAGDSLFYRDRFDMALVEYRRAQQHDARALEQRPNDRRLIDHEAISRWSSSLALSELGRHAEALADSDQALAQAERLIALDPGNDNARRLRQTLRSDRALVLGRLGRFDEAIALAQTSLAERHERERLHPELSEPARDAIVPLHGLADLYWQRGDHTRACTLAREAVTAWTAYARRWGLTDLDRRQSEDKARETAQRCGA